MFRVRQQIGCTDQVTKITRGRGVTVALLDTGIFLHPDFRGRVVAFRDFVNHRQEAYDDSGHGTHVAGCLGGSGYVSGGKFRGIAPECNFVIGKILDKEGEGDMRAMLAAIQWVLECRKQYGIRILNISIGLSQLEEKERIQTLVSAMEEAWKQGILVVAAAGNRGPGPMSLSPLGKGKQVLTVGCHDGGYREPGVTPCESYSGRGPSEQVLKKPDLVAPGTNIVSTCHLCRRKGGYFTNAYVAKSGTSMAAPLVAGAAALLLEREPLLTNEEVKWRLLYSAKDLGEPWSKQGWGMLNLSTQF